MFSLGAQGSSHSPETCSLGLVGFFILIKARIYLNPNLNRNLLKIQKPSISFDPTPAGLFSFSKTGFCALDKAKNKIETCVKMKFSDGQQSENYKKDMERNSFGHFRNIFVIQGSIFSLSSYGH